MRILGIDPGLKATGYGFIDYQDNRIKLLEAGTIEPKEKDLIQNRIRKVYANLDDLVVKYRPDVMVLEKLYSHYEHPTTACKLGHVRGVICLLCANREIKLVEHSVKRIRKTIVGSGGASKLQTQSVVAHILNIDEQKLTLDASDALALALGYINIDNRTI
ncbi:MAG: crossover junction endodeoxyribonuclease RuvC [Candidatus Omnitrophota bacterium]